MAKNILIVNFKTYENSTGKKALKLAKICEKVSLRTGKKIAVAVQACDLHLIKENVKIDVYAQHVDYHNQGQSTGFVTVEAIKNFKGTLLNHSEHQINEEIIAKTMLRIKEKKLISVICANNVKKGILLSKYKPNYIAIEPPELIGGKISVSSANPKLISDSVKKINCDVIVGAGINSSEDVKIAVKLGAKGLLVASSVVKAKNQEKILMDLVKYL
jgi:triosephosphate isomerase (TIM)